MDSVYVMDIQLAGMHGYKATPFAYLALMFSVCSFKLSCHWCPPLVPSIARGAYLGQAVLREAGKNSTWRLPGNGVGDAKHTPGVGAGGNFRALCTCVNVTFPAAQRVVMLPLYSPASLASLGIPMAGPLAPNLRISFAIPKRLLSVPWRTNSEVT